MPPIDDPNTPAAETPAAPASAEAPQEPQAPSGDRGDAAEPEEIQNFDDLLSEPKDEEDDLVVPPAPAAASSPQPSAPQTPPAAPAAQTPAVATPPTSPAQAAPTAPAAQTPPAPAQAATPQEPAPAASAAGQPPVQPDFEALRKGTIDEIAKQVTFTDEEKAQLLEAPHEVLPKLYAQSVVMAYESVSRAVFAHLPALVANVIQNSNQIKERETAFFDHWKGLNKPEYREALITTGNLYRAQNPNASLEDTIKAVGSMVAFQLQIPLEQAMGVAAQAVQPGVTPPATQTPGLAPHIPAAPGSTGLRPAAQDDNPWSKMAQEFEELM